MDEWAANGLPGTGHTSCKGNCRCVMLPESFLEFDAEIMEPFQIADAAHTGHNLDFFFLPPMVPDPSGHLAFDDGGIGDRGFQGDHLGLLALQLPGGGRANICSKRDTYPDGRDFVGVGIAPDIVVEPTVENWRLLSQAWMLAHEDARAIEALTRAAALSGEEGNGCLTQGKCDQNSSPASSRRTSRSFSTA